MLPDVASFEQWRTFLHRCLAHRIDVDEFKELSKLLLYRSPLEEDELLDLLLDVRASSSIVWDPLLPVYIDGLCKNRQVKRSSALKCLLKHSSIRGKDASKQKAPSLMMDIKVIQDVMLSVSTGSLPRTISEAAELYSATVEWIDAVVAWNNGGSNDSQQTDGLMNSPDAVSLVESLGILLAALSGTSKGVQVLSSENHQGDYSDLNLLLAFTDSPFGAGLRTKLGQALTSYLPLCVDVSLPLRHRLDALQKEFNLFGEQASHSKPLDQSPMEGMNVNGLQFEASVMDGPVINTRAGLYVYLNAMVSLSLY